MHRRQRMIDSGFVGYRDSRRCSRDTYLESYIRILVHEDWDAFKSMPVYEDLRDALTPGQRGGVGQPHGVGCVAICVSRRGRILLTQEVELQGYLGREKQYLSRTLQ